MPTNTPIVTVEPIQPAEPPRNVVLRLTEDEAEVVAAVLGKRLYRTGCFTPTTTLYNELDGQGYGNRCRVKPYRDGYVVMPTE